MGQDEDTIILKNRETAAELLAKKLEKYKVEKPLVLAIPRGAVPMGAVIAKRLSTDMDIVLVHKIGHPSEPELAIGSVTEYGDIFLPPGMYSDLDPQALQTSAKEQIDLLKRKRREYASLKPAPANPEGRVVIIIDDGIATGSTMIAAIRSIKAKHPKKVIVAAPVISENAYEILKNEAHELVYLAIPPIFFSVGQFYKDFSQVTDSEVAEILMAATKQII